MVVSDFENKELLPRSRKRRVTLPHKQASMQAVRYLI